MKDFLRRERERIIHVCRSMGGWSCESVGVSQSARVGFVSHVHRRPGGLAHVLHRRYHHYDTLR